MQVLDQSVQEVVTIPPAASVSDAAHLMRRAGVGCLVVTEGDRPVGVVTDRDLCLRVVAPRSERAEERRVEEVMSSPPETLPTDATVDDAVRAMRTLGVRRMPVVSPEGDLVGLVALDDLLALLAGALHDLAVEALESRRHAWREARGERAREEMEHLVSQVRERARQARWTAQETFFDELDALRQRARELFGLDG